MKSINKTVPSTPPKCYYKEPRGLSEYPLIRSLLENVQMHGKTQEILRNEAYLFVRCSNEG